MDNRATIDVRDLIDLAIEIVGSQAKLGDACDVTQAAIWKAKDANRVSAELALKIHAATGGRVSKHDLRPDIFGKKPARRQSGKGTPNV